MLIVTRSLRGVIAPLLTSVLGLLISFGIIGWTGIYIDMTTMMIAVILTFACSIAYNIHLYNFFKTRFVETGRRRHSIIDAMGETGWGVSLSALTTVAAMMTFLSMNIVPMQAIGLNGFPIVRCHSPTGSPTSNEFITGIDGRPITFMNFTIANLLTAPAIVFKVSFAVSLLAFIFLNCCL